MGEVTKICEWRRRVRPRDILSICSPSAKVEGIDAALVPRSRAAAEERNLGAPYGEHMSM